MWCGTSYGDCVVQDATEVMFEDQEVCGVRAAAHAGHRVETGEDVIRLRPSARREHSADPGQRKGTRALRCQIPDSPRQMRRMISCGLGGTSSWPPRQTVCAG